jgi:hypothetical protein
MMESFEITDLNTYTQLVNDLAKSGSDLVLYRGQCNDDALLPGIGRIINDAEGNNISPVIKSDTEQEMLNEFKKKLPNFFQGTFQNEWDLLAVCQHHGMATRLLDWTQNPLIALWFACNSAFIHSTYSVIWVIPTQLSYIYRFDETQTPFEIDGTKIISPNWVARRIANQSGLFTIHTPGDNAGNLIFKNLDEDETFDPLLRKFIIPKNKRAELIKELNVYGISHSSVFPDLDGLCKSLNWQYLDR